jgi:hypothetical protein
MSTLETKLPFEIQVCVRIEANDVYCLNGLCIVRLRDGRAERLEGLEKEQFRRWILRKDGAPPTKETP